MRQIAGGESQKVTSRHTNQNGRTGSITNYVVDMKRKEYITTKACITRHCARWKVANWRGQESASLSILVLQRRARVGCLDSGVDDSDGNPFLPSTPLRVLRHCQDFYSYANAYFLWPVWEATRAQLQVAGRSQIPMAPVRPREK